MNDIGAVLRECRKEAKVTQEQLAKEIGVTANAISMYESGRRNFPIELVEPACSVFHIEVKEFMNRVFPDGEMGEDN